MNSKTIQTHFKLGVIEFITISLLVVLIYLSIYFNENPEKAQIIQFATYQTRIISLQAGLWITFIICILGNLIPLPTPYVLITWIVAQKYIEQHIFIPLLVAFVASLGSLLGELVGYFLGRGTGEFLEGRENVKIKMFYLLLEKNPRLAPFIIYIFGATPLNDTFITIPLGMIKYSIKNTVFWCWLGKLTMMIVFAYIPDYLEILSAEYSFLTSMLPLFLVVLVMYFIIRADWILILAKFPFISRYLHLHEVLEDFEKEKIEEDE